MKKQKLNDVRWGCYPNHKQVIKSYDLCLLIVRKMCVSKNDRAGKYTSTYPCKMIMGAIIEGNVIQLYT